ncbi:hypothetical protein ALC53_10195 [Atta colombica]|uniref:Uncharacterized protein n=1 Tax=Atta colombica TaxID=520822 RepID=A0A195B545_9HYME|nr:hypothetical protein ALC53_10195 [Atta colombica]
MEDWAMNCDTDVIDGRVDCLECKQRKRAHLRDREVAFNKPPFASAVRVALPPEVVEPRCLLGN